MKNENTTSNNIQILKNIVLRQFQLKQKNVVF